MPWHFCTEKNSKKIEKVQERALRFVYEDYNSSYDNLLLKAKVPSLQFHRMRTMALETFKIMNKQSPSCLQFSITLCIDKIQNIILDTTIYWTFHRSEHQGMANKHLNLLQLHCGTTSHTISGLNTVFLNLRS